MQSEGKGMNFNTPSRGQDTEDGWSKQTASNRLDPSSLVRQQALGDVEGSEGLRELVARTRREVPVAVLLQQLKCLRLHIYFVLIEPALSIYFTAGHFITFL